MPLVIKIVFKVSHMTLIDINHVYYKEKCIMLQSFLMLLYINYNVCLNENQNIENGFINNL